MLSDESSSDSDSGIRFKTQSTRAERQTDAATSSRFPGRGGCRDRPNRTFEDRRFGDRRDRFDERSNRFQDRSPINNRGRDRRGSPPRRRISPHNRERHSPQRDRITPQNREQERRRSPPRDKFRRISPARDRLRKASQDRPSKREHSVEKIQIDRNKDEEKHRNSRDRREVRRPEESHEKRRDFREEIRKNITPVDEPKRKAEKTILKSFDERKAPHPRQRIRSGQDFQTPPQRVQHDSDKVNAPSSPHGRHSNSKRSISPEVEANKRKHSPHERNPNKAKRPSPDITSLKPDTKTKRTSTSRDPKLEIVKRPISSDVEEQPTSYYNIIPDKIKGYTEKIVVEESSEDEETLRAKLLHLEKELKKTKKVKSKKKEKKHKKSKDRCKSKDRESSQVTSTTDIVLETETEPVCEHHEGPALPPHLKPTIHDLTADISSTQPRKSINESNEEGEIVTDTEDPPIDIDATDLRHRLKKGVADSIRIVSPDLRVKLKNRGSGESGSQEEGPALPPNLAKRNIGPSIPSNMREVLAKRPVREDIPKSSSEDEGIGPVPHGDKSKWTKAHESLEERALKMKIDALDGSQGRDDVKAREEWMLELPDAKAKIIGLGPRQFRAKEAPDMSDRSSWTDTPEERARKATGTHVPETTSVDIQREAEIKRQEERDRDHELAVKKHKKKHKRDESLLDLHQRKLKKKKKKEDKEKNSDEKVRRPFSRDTDLQVNKFDEAQKKSIIKKAQHLDTRFSRGEAKFL